MTTDDAITDAPGNAHKFRRFAWDGLSFDLPADWDLAIYRFENETIGSHEFMIVPLGPEQQHQRYEAIFN